MSIQKIQMFTVICDNCKESADKSTGYSCWSDEISAKDVAMEAGFIRKNNNDYCSKCYHYNDEDELIINTERTELENKLILDEIKKINERVEEVCPSVSLSQNTLISNTKDLLIKKNNSKYQSCIEELKYKNNLAIKVFEYALTFVIHDNLRKLIEKYLKILKK